MQRAHGGHEADGVAAQPGMERSARDQRRSSATVRRICISAQLAQSSSASRFTTASSESKSGSEQQRPSPDARFGQVIALGVGREGAMLHVFAVALDGGAEERGSVGVAADEFGRRRKGEIHEIVEDENLAVAIGTGADADRRNGERGGDGRGGFAGNAFENDGAGAGVSEREGIGLKLAARRRRCGPARDSRPCDARFAA